MTHADSQQDSCQPVNIVTDWSISNSSIDSIVSYLSLAQPPFVLQWELHSTFMSFLSES